MRTFKEQQELWELENLSKYAKKSAQARKWKIDSPDPYRTDYQRDIMKILFSDAFRRLRMKTQVFIASGANQHNRTRLTHSLEVAQIAKCIAKPLLLNVDLTEAIALGHDLGHTPFGHAGESALNGCLKEKTTFNHNVQSVWILRTTWCWRKNIDGEEYRGFNLTHDTNEGIWKHTKYTETVDEYPDLKYYNPNMPSSLEGQVVDIADGIAYLRHDTEDGKRNKLITNAEVEDVWVKNTDLPFDERQWSYNFIYDVITNSEGKNIISFTPDMKNLHNAIKELVKEKIIKSSMVSQKDSECKEKICTIYDYCLGNQDYVVNKHRRRNEKIKETHGIERVITDYIQWLGDENADLVYQNIINKKQLAEKEDDLFFEEE